MCAIIASHYTDMCAISKKFAMLIMRRCKSRHTLKKTNESRQTLKKKELHELHLNSLRCIYVLLSHCAFYREPKMSRLRELRSVACTVSKFIMFGEGEKRGEGEGEIVCVCVCVCV